MSKNGNDFLCLALLNQSIINDNVLLPRHAEEVGVRMSTSLASIDDIKLMKGELQSLSKTFNTSLQVARLKRGKFVE
jgi:hypothetical protein